MYMALHLPGSLSLQKSQKQVKHLPLFLCIGCIKEGQITRITSIPFRKLKEIMLRTTLATSMNELRATFPQNRLKGVFRSIGYLTIYSTVHFYTADDLAMLTMLDPSQGYVLENGSAGFGVEAYVYPSFVEGMVPMYRINECSIESPGHYFMCIREHEYKSALTNPAWCFDDEGLVAYVSPDGVLDPLAHRRPQANFGGADLGTGAYRGLNSLDLLMKGRGPDLGFAHYYNSFNFAEYPMGPGWSHNLDSYIIEEVVPIEDQASEKPNIYVKWGDGSGSAFQSTGTEAGEYKDLTGNHDLLTRIDDGVNYGYDLTKKDQTVYQYRRLSINPPPEVASFCSANPENVFCNKIVLLRISDWAGNTLTFEYDAAAAYLLAVRDDMGRRLELDYHVPSNLLKSITERVSGTEKRTVSFSYNTEDLLETFADANGEITRYSYYNEPATQRHQLLKTITYPMLNTVTIDYDQVTGKVTSVKDAASSARVRLITRRKRPMCRSLIRKTTSLIIDSTACCQAQ